MAGTPESLKHLFYYMEIFQEKPGNFGSFLGNVENRSMEMVQTLISTCVYD